MPLALHVHRVFAERAMNAARARLDDGTTRIVILGDSVAHGAGDERGGGVARDLRTNAEVVNLGVNGARTGDVRRLLQRGTARNAIADADVIVVSIGGNDLYGDSVARLLAALAPDRLQSLTVRKVERVVAAMHAVNAAARVVLLGLYNPYHRSRVRAWLDTQVNRWDARLIARFAAARDVTVIRIADLFARDDRISTIDRFHPGALGYAAIAQRIAASL